MQASDKIEISLFVSQLHKPEAVSTSVLVWFHGFNQSKQEKQYEILMVCNMILHFHLRGYNFEAWNYNVEHA